ncbi:site-specific integrase [Cupriavidus sp. D39]|uniref:site-specific integrase n=1 Tax=Cupriavidus sp. D39 TaxID=2997877 RepID=UPI00226E578E|nr:site-specific integrase [Cupriavidus sp. D39]MCY0857565.1 site-specific integrase [Cupriavidus sp. D39]
MQSFAPRPLRPWKIVHHPIREAGVAVRLTPVLYVGPGLCAKRATAYSEHLSATGLEDATIKKKLQVIGRLYGFWIVRDDHGIPLPRSARQLLILFGMARIRSTYEADKHIDELGLYWPAVRFAKVCTEIRILTEYGSFLHLNYGADEINPVIHPLDATDRNLTSFARSDTGKGDILAHLSKYRHPKQQRYYEPVKKRDKRKRGIPKYIYPSDMVELVDNGCICPRDKMIVLLMGYAMLRASEVLHLFLSDVADVLPSGAAKVLLGHPGDEMVSWASSTGLKEATRREYLRTQFRRAPRNEIGIGHPEYAGWKGMTFQSDDPEERYAIWIEEEIVGRYFRHLLLEYLSEHKGLLCSGAISHPYLFFNTDRRKSGDGYGEPLKNSAFEKLFMRAAKRIDLPAHRHMCRHHGGFYMANVAKLPIELAQKALRHGSPESTTVYYLTHPTTVRAELQRRLEPGATHENYLDGLSMRPNFPSRWRSA